MMTSQKHVWSKVELGLLCLFLAGCASTPAIIVEKPTANAQSLGRVKATASGSVLGIFPILENSRTERAYAAALAQAPGATALRDVTIQENWYWFYIGTMRSVTVEGEAVK